MTVDPACRRALLSLADDVERRASSLVEEMVATKHVLPTVAQGDLDLAVRRLRSFETVEPFLADRNPVGTVALVLAGNALLSNPLGTIGCASLAGNAVRVRFPRASRSWSSTVRRLVGRHLADVSFSEAPGPEFIGQAATDPRVGVVMVFGADVWASGYEQLMRETGTTFVFEGGGNCPFLVLAGADLGRAAGELVRGAFHNAGQACTSPERAYVEAAAYRELLDRVVALADGHVVGDPEDPAATVGPLVGRAAGDRLAAQLDGARHAGATVCTGGRSREGRLADGTEVTWVPPTVLTGVEPGCAVMREESFGPVVTVTPVRDAAEAVRAASRYEYGLAATVFGGGPAHRRLLAGTHGRVFGDEIWLDHDRRELHGPFGGRKRSGWVWATEDGEFVRREGPRWNALELSAPRPRAACRRQEQIHA